MAVDVLSVAVDTAVDTRGSHCHLLLVPSTVRVIRSSSAVNARSPATLVARFSARKVSRPVLRCRVNFDVAAARLSRGDAGGCGGLHVPRLTKGGSTQRCRAESVADFGTGRPANELSHVALCPPD